MAISPDGKTLADRRRGVGLWDLETGQERLEIDTDSKPIFGLAFLQYGNQLLATIGSGVSHWEIRDVKLHSGDFKLTHFGSHTTHGTTLFSLAASPETGLWVWADARGVVEIRHGGFGYAGRIFAGQDRIWSAALAPNGKTLATASRDGTVKIWDITRDADRRSTEVGTRMMSDLLGIPRTVEPW